MLGAGFQYSEDTRHRLGFGFRVGGDPAQSALLDVPNVLHQRRRHLLWRQDIIDEAGGDGAARHACILGRLFVLRHGHADLALDGLDAAGSVAAGAREHDGNRAASQTLGERTEEAVDG